jgi:hypothetical protein
MWYAAGGGAFAQTIVLVVAGLFFSLYVLIALSAYRDMFSLERELWEATSTGAADRMFAHLDEVTRRARRGWLVAFGVGVGVAFTNSMVKSIPLWAVAGVAVASLVVLLALTAELVVSIRFLDEWRTNWKRVKIERGRQIEHQKRTASEAAIKATIARAQVAKPRERDQAAAKV